MSVFLSTQLNNKIHALWAQEDDAITQKYDNNWQQPADHC